MDKQVDCIIKGQNIYSGNRCSLGTIIVMAPNWNQWDFNWPSNQLTDFLHRIIMMLINLAIINARKGYLSNYDFKFS